MRGESSTGPTGERLRAFPFHLTTCPTSAVYMSPVSKNSPGMVRRTGRLRPHRPSVPAQVHTVADFGDPARPPALASAMPVSASTNGCRAQVAIAPFRPHRNPPRHTPQTPSNRRRRRCDDNTGHWRRAWEATSHPAGQRIPHPRGCGPRGHKPSRCRATKSTSISPTATATPAATPSTPPPR